MEKKIFAIILARGNSKSIKNKNLKKINGKPLLFWSIEQLKKTKSINQIWISSDSDKILKYAFQNNINIIKRPKKISTAKASSESAWLHAVSYLEKKKLYFDTIVGVQPTSPIRDSNDFDSAIRIFIKKKYDSLFTSSIIKDYLVWKKNYNILKSNYDYKRRKPRQLIKKQFLENGSFYIFDKNKFKRYKCRLFGKIGTYIQNFYKSFQVDEPEDFHIVESILKNKYLKNES
ncbi:NeuA CMP-N-acetylneuraminic acid synthetase [Candidatus Pelagibacterales bacterium]